MDIRKAIAGNLFAGSLGRVINALSPLVLVPLMISTWGLHEYGEWLILTAIPTYMMLSPDFGLAGAVVNQMAISTAKGNRREAICLYRTSWIFLTIMALLFATAGALVGYFVNWKHVGVSGIAPQAAAIIALACVQIFIGQQAFLVGGIYRSARQNPRGGLLASVGGAFYLATAIATLALKGSPVTYIAASVSARAVFLLVFLIDSRRIMPDFTLGLSGVSVRAVRPYIVPGLGHATMPLVNAFQNEGMVLVLGVLLGPVSVAIFQTTRTAVNGAKTLMGLLASAILVEIPALVGEGRLTAIRRLLVLNTQTAVVATSAWLILLVTSGNWIFHLWLHNRAVYSLPLVTLMLVALFPFALANSFTLVLLATNKIYRAVIWLVPAGALSLAIAALGAHFIGLIGAAFGMVAFEALSMLVMCTVTARHTELGVRRTFREVLSRQSIDMAYRSAASWLRSAAAE